jgi:hypothetical protein
MINRSGRPLIGNLSSAAPRSKRPHGVRVCAVSLA